MRLVATDNRLEIFVLLYLSIYFVLVSSVPFILILKF